MGWRKSKEKDDAHDDDVDYGWSDEEKKTANERDK